MQNKIIRWYIIYSGYDILVPCWHCVMNNKTFSLCFTNTNSDVGEAEVVEIVDYVKRSEDGRRKFIISALGDNIELNLQNAVGLLPQTLPVSVINVDQDGNQIVEDWTHTVSSIISITIFSELPMVFLWIQH